MSVSTIEEIYFHPHTFYAFVNIPDKNRSSFLFNYRFGSLFYRVNQLLLTCCFDFHEFVVKKHRVQATCFIRYFPKKEGCVF